MLFSANPDLVLAQQKKGPQINDVFFQYVVKTLPLTPAESKQMRPLVKNYLTERKKITANYKDPLEREQQILNLKKRSRQNMAAVIGMKKANSFFSSEQAFRRKVRDELKNRKQDSQKKN
ncbi:hypothetical protein ABDK00_002650 [Niabella insulamsoli]|uniref:hypothetical protein n=1 Tax=Niabella insulamsoli TaxID=3144874 RepID=UPI0031FD283F